MSLISLIIVKLEQYKAKTDYINKKALFQNKKKELQLKMNSTENISNTSRDYLFDTLIQIDNLSNYLALLIHFAYYLLILTSAEIRTRSFLYVNHATITSSFFIISLFGYMFGNEPDFPDPTLNGILCSFSELFWPFAVYIRSYSILLIAIYRYLAVFKLNLFKKINSSLWYLTAPLLVAWTLSIVFPLLLKYSLQTTYSSIFCFDGYSPHYLITIVYFVLNNLLNVSLPSLAILIIYWRILSKLKHLKKNLNSSTKQNANKESRFAHQFLLMSLSIIISGSVLSISQLRNVIYDYTNVLFYWRPVFRITRELSMSLVPVTAIFYHPRRDRVFRFFKPKINPK
jgi:hypothetical protein